MGGREGGGAAGRLVGLSGFRVGTAAPSPLLTFLTSASPSLSAVMRRCLSSAVVLPPPPLLPLPLLLSPPVLWRSALKVGVVLDVCVR